MAVKETSKARIEGNVPVTIFKEGKTYVAYAPVLDLSSCGTSFGEAEKNIREAIRIFLAECIKDHILEDVLASLGWRQVNKRSKKWSPPPVVGQLEIPVSVGSSLSA